MNRPKNALPPSGPAAFVLLTGDDIISRETARERLLSALHAKLGSAPTVSSFDPSVETLSAFLARFITVSMFPEARVFQIRHADLLDDGELAEVAAYLDHDLPDTFLVIEAETAGSPTGRGAKMGRLVKAFQKHAKEHPDRYLTEDFPKPRDYEIPGWIVQNVPRLFNRTITPKNAELLVDLVGADLGTIHSELQKIDVHLDPGASIERRDIDHICGASREMAPFELAQALGKRDLARALEIIDGLFSSSFYAPLFVSAAFRHFWALWRIRAFAKKFPDDMQRFLNAVKHFDKQTQSAIGARIGEAAGLFTAQQSGRVYPVLIKQDLVGQARAFKDDHLSQIFTWLYEFDVGTKTGKCEGDKESIQLLCHRIARVGEI